MIPGVRNENLCLEQPYWVSVHEGCLSLSQFKQESLGDETVFWLKCSPLGIKSPASLVLVTDMLSVGPNISWKIKNNEKILRQCLAILTVFFGW